MHLMRRIFDWLKLPAAISAELAQRFIWRPAKSAVFAGAPSPAGPLGVGVDESETHANGGGGADIRAADG
jgi:hypothetical protein